ncbi:helix-turn-helix domain-containing protein [Erythrobacter sp. NE805]|uniref:helix-turn-helix transcriptional regulator n=1 Tax=Erythrobacter sp. NE805 TaxID=3389875 RepID=UPI00396B33B0
MIPPPASLARSVHTFYVIETGAAPVEETVPAYSAQLIVMVRGSVAFTFADGRTGCSSRVFVNAPQLRSANSVLEGPVLQIGASLTHAAWQRLSNLPADVVHDRLISAEAILAPERIAALEAAAEACDAGRIGPEAVCAELAATIAAGPFDLRSDHVEVVETILAWLASGFDPDIRALYEAVRVSPRQVQRICRRFFGVPPAQVLKRFRALRAAMVLAQPGLGEAHRDALMATYFDQAHLIRDIRRYTGRTPTQLRQPSVMRALLDPASHGDAGAPLMAAAG